jgi:hypothetical protein
MTSEAEATVAKGAMPSRSARPFKTWTLVGHGVNVYTGSVILAACVRPDDDESSGSDGREKLLCRDNSVDGYSGLRALFVR